MFDRLGELASEHAELERVLADAAVHADPDRAKVLSRRYGELSHIVEAYHDWQQTVADEETARELAPEDASFAAEAEQLSRRRADLESQINALLVPRDRLDSKDVILQVKAGEGGEESALFAGDLLRMYLRYAERRGWKTEVIDSTMTGLGGYKDVTVAVKSPGRSAAPAGRTADSGARRLIAGISNEHHGRFGEAATRSHRRGHDGVQEGAGRNQGRPGCGRGSHAPPGARQGRQEGGARRG